MLVTELVYLRCPISYAFALSTNSHRFVADTDNGRHIRMNILLFPISVRHWSHFMFTGVLKSKARGFLSDFLNSSHRMELMELERTQLGLE